MCHWNYWCWSCDVVASLCGYRHGCFVRMIRSNHTTCINMFFSRPRKREMQQTANIINIHHDMLHVWTPTSMFIQISSCHDPPHNEQPHQPLPIPYWTQLIPSLQSPASTTSVPNFLSRLRSESRVKHNQAAYQNIQIRVSDCQIVTGFRNKINNQSLYTAQLIDCQIEHSKTIPTVQTHQLAHFREDCTFFFPSPSRMHVLQNQANDGKQLQVI